MAKPGCRGPGQLVPSSTHSALNLAYLESKHWMLVCFSMASFDLGFYYVINLTCYLVKAVWIALEAEADRVWCVTDGAGGCSQTRPLVRSHLRPNLWSWIPTRSPLPLWPSGLCLGVCSCAPKAALAAADVPV